MTPTIILKIEDHKKNILIRKIGQLLLPKKSQLTFPLFFSGNIKTFHVWLSTLSTSLPTS